MDLYYQALSLYRRRKYDECIEICNNLLKTKHSHGQGPWELKMRAVTLRVYVDDIEADDGIPDNDDEDVGGGGGGGTAKPGTSIRASAVAATAGPGTSTAATKQIKTYSNRPRTTAGRPLTGMVRPGTASLRPGSSMRMRTTLRTAGGSATAGGLRTTSARNFRLGTATLFSLSDPTGPLIDMSKLNLRKFLRQVHLLKLLFKYLYYHEGNLKLAIELCELLTTDQPTLVNWWWNAQQGRCYIFLGAPKKAEPFLRKSIQQFNHPDTALLLARVYVKLDQPLDAIEMLGKSLEKLPDDIGLLTHQSRIMELMGNLDGSSRTYRYIVQLEPINAEALASIAVHHFYGNQPEMALVYYRRILSMGGHSCELYCNLGLCCLYGGQFDLMLPLFQRAIRLAGKPEQRADVWYNISFVGLAMGDFTLAKRCLKLCLSADGSHGAALNNLAILIARDGQKAKAKLNLLAAKNILPNCNEIIVNLKLLENK